MHMRMAGFEAATVKKNFRQAGIDFGGHLLSLNCGFFLVGCDGQNNAVNAPPDTAALSHSKATGPHCQTADERLRFGKAPQERMRPAGRTSPYSLTP
jgi:hypothetical protein